MSIVRSTVDQNSTDGLGGGVVAFPKAKVPPPGSLAARTSIFESSISGNTASQGGGVRTRNSFMTIADSLIDDNVATVAGGGVSAIQDFTNLSRSEEDDDLEINVGSGFSIPTGGLKLAGGGGNNRLVIKGDQGAIDLSDPAVDATDLTEIDLTSEDATTVSIDAETVGTLSPETRRIVIRTAQGDRIVVKTPALWRLIEPKVIDGEFRLTAALQTPADAENGNGAESEDVAAQAQAAFIEATVQFPWRNFLQEADVNNDGVVTTIDALDIINELTRKAFSSFIGGKLDNPLEMESWPGIYFDTSGDGAVSAFDALRVINAVALSVGSPSSAADGELIASTIVETPGRNDEHVEPRDESPELLSKDSSSKPRLSTIVESSEWIAHVVIENQETDDIRQSENELESIDKFFASEFDC